jgi:L-asparaginase II
VQPLAYVTRGNLIESIHYGDLAVCDAAGHLVASLGDPERVIYWRSSAKPIQALTVVHSGAADRFELSAKQLSVCCASHCGSAEHVETVRSVLERVGLDESALQCGVHWPSDTAERDRLIRAGAQPSLLHNNCSGKHSGMLASTVALGADVSRYLELSQPVQQSILADLSVLCDVPVADIQTGVDGCGAPVHGMPLRAMATGFARLGWPDKMPERIQKAAPRVIAAMCAEPVMVSARGSFNSDLLGASYGRVVAKGGAEGLFVLGLTVPGLGIAVRNVDGSGRGHAPVVLRTLELLGALPDDMRQALASYATQHVMNCRGQSVGEIRPAFEALNTPA